MEWESSVLLTRLACEFESSILPLHYSTLFSTTTWSEPWTLIHEPSMLVATSAFQTRETKTHEPSTHARKQVHVHYLWRFPPRGLGASAPSIILAGKNQCQPVPQPRGSAHSLEDPNRWHRVFLTSVLAEKFWLRAIIWISLRGVKKFKRRSDWVSFHGATGVFVTGWDWNFPVVGFWRLEFH